MPRRSKTVHKKSRGRPAGLKYGETIPARFESETVKTLDSWAHQNGVSRSQAIRQLVEIGLQSKIKALVGKQKLAEFIREAVERELKRREKQEK
jgi:hypothetical protein